MQQLKTTATTQDGTTVEVITTQKEGETQDELLARHLAMVEKVKASGGE